MSDVGGSTWWADFRRDLSPTPGRLGKSLRVALASVVTLVLIMTFRLPFGSLGLYFVLLSNRATPALSWRSSLAIFGSMLVAVCVVLGMTALTNNDPIFRLLSVGVVAFVGGVFIHQSSIPTLGSVTGFIFANLIASWEIEAHPGANVESNLWIIPTMGTALLVSIAVEYVFAYRDPVLRLQDERIRRYALLEKMFTAFAAAAPAGELVPIVRTVEALAAAGDADMQELYASLANRGLSAGPLPPAMQVRIAMLTRLLDLAAAFGVERGIAMPLRGDEALLRERCARIAQVCGAQRATVPPATAAVGPLEGHLDALGHVEGALAEILRMPRDATADGGTCHADLVYVAPQQVPLLAAHAFQDRAALAFAAKLSACATFCYFLYHAVGWPGISTCVVTVMISGLGDSGGTKQRLTLRLVGAIVGGLVLGLGSVALLFPTMETITPLVLLVAAVAFVASWLGSGRQFGYLGPQIAFSFYSCAISGFAPSTALAPARDNFAGITLAALVMWVVFDHIAPVATRTVLRRMLASTLRGVASLFVLRDTAFSHAVKTTRGRLLRYQVGKLVSAIRATSEVARYEVGPGRAADVSDASRMVGIAFDAASMFWRELALLYTEGEAPVTSGAEADERRGVAQGLTALAVALERDTPRADAIASAPPMTHGPHGYPRVRDSVLALLRSGDA